LIVVSDTSPILNLARIRRLSLLPALYHVVTIPSAVADELKHALRDLSPSIDFDSEPWLMVRAGAEPSSQLIHTARFWLGAELYAAVLSELGEE
jgi:predicted nucleic acid-binding protein